MSRKILVVLTAISILLVSVPLSLLSQGDQAFQGKLESILSSFKNYRFSTISVYKITDIKDFRAIIKEEKEKSLTGGMVTEDTKVIDEADEVVKSTIERGVQSNQGKTQIQRQLLLNLGIDISQEDFDAIYNYYFTRFNNVQSITIRNVYVITTRKNPDELVPNTIIGMIATDEDKSMLKENMDNPGASNIYTLPELKEYELSDEYSAETMLELIQNAFLQGNVEDITLQAQGIGTFISFAPKQAGVSKSLIFDEGDVREGDIQVFKRISEGQPLDIVGKQHEVIVSADYISWRKYEFDRYYDASGNLVVDSLYPTNKLLPKYGVELKYGNTDINYPSFWSDRWALNAIWDNVKAGIILPDNGWADIHDDLFEDVERKLTHAGVGLTAQFDFPIAVIPESGIFRFSAGGVFGDAQPMEFKNRETEDADRFSQADEEQIDYLIRFNAQFHPTFGISIDNDYLLRFGLGATFYSLEKWNYQLNPEDRSQIQFAENGTESIFGVSGTLEFMKQNSTTPFGASVQYFDSGVFLGAWILVPVIENTFSIKLDGQGYFKWFADQPRAWENDNVVMPNIRFILNF